MTKGENDLTGAMVHQACIHATTIKDKGWNWYVNEMEKRDEEEENER